MPVRVRRMPVFFGQLKFRFILVLAIFNGAEHPLSVFQSLDIVFACVSSCILSYVPTYCVAAGGVTDVVVWGWQRWTGWQRRLWKRDENIIIANVIFATRRTPFVRKLAKKYIFFTATRHPWSSKDDGEEGVKIIAGC